MRVVFMGYMTWGYRTLEAILEAGHQVPLVITHPDSDNPYETIFNDSVAELAGKHDVPVLTRTRAHDPEVIARVRAAEADAMVVANWRTRLRPEVFTLPRLGTLNVHDALLPAYAGFAPLNWALINGEPEVGVTAHMMDADFDAGDIVLQWATPIGDDDTVVDLFDRTLAMFGPIAVAGLAGLATGRIDPTPQDRSRASYFHRRSDTDNRMDWAWPARDLANLVRAQVDPYPNAWCLHEGERLRILEARATERPYGGTPGRIFIRDDDGGVVVVAGPEARRGRDPGLSIRRVRTADGRELAAPDYFTSMGGYLA